MNETIAGIYIGVVTNLALTALLNNPPWGGSPDLAAWLVSLGTWNEILGVLMVASPELIPRAQLGWRAVRHRLRPIRLAIMRGLGRLIRVRRSMTVHIGQAAEVNLAGSVGLRVIRGDPKGTTDERVDRLLVLYREHDDRLHRLEEDIVRLPEQWQADVAAMRQELEGLSHDLVQRVANARIRLRLAGLSYVIFGLSLSWAGNLL